MLGEHLKSSSPKRDKGQSKNRVCNVNAKFEDLAWKNRACLLLFYAIATSFQLCHGGGMMYETRRRKPEPTFLLT